MVFEFASQSGDSGSSDRQNAPVFNNYPADTVCKNTPSDTTSNAAVDSLPAVSFAGALSQQFSGAVEQQPVFRTIAKDAAPPVPQATNPFAVPGQTTPGQFPPVANPFNQPLLLNPEPSAVLQPGQFRDNPPKPQPGPFPQPGTDPNPNPFRPIPFKPLQPPKPGPDSPDLRDKPLPPGPFSPAPMSASGFSADQVRSILSDRDRAIALNRGQKPTTDRPGVGPIAPAPDGRNPFRPDAVPDKVKPPKTEFLNGELDEAVKAAKDSGRPLVISFTKPGCGYCTKIENESWPSQKGLVDNDGIRTKVNGANRRDLAQKYGVRSYPTTIVVNPNTMEPVDKSVGFVSSEELGSFLQNAFQKMKGGG